VEGTFDPEYTIRLPNEAAIRLIPAFTYTSEMFNGSLNTPVLRRPSSAARRLDPLRIGKRPVRPCPRRHQPDQRPVSDGRIA